MKHPPPPPPPPAIVDVAEVDDRRALREPDFEEPAESAPCPQCKYVLAGLPGPGADASDFAMRPRTNGPMPVDICVNCGEFMTFDASLDDAEERFSPPGQRRHTPTPVLTTSMDFARFSPATCRQLLQAQSIAHRLARLRGYSLGKIKLRGGSA